MSPKENKDLIRRYIEAIDANDSSDWSVLDEFIAADFISHHPPAPGVTLDRDGMKQAAEIFRIGTTGSHEIMMQVAEDEFVVSLIVGRGVHTGELFGIPATNNEIESEGIAIHRVHDGKIVEYWSVVDQARVLRQLGVLPEPPALAPVRGRCTCVHVLGGALASCPHICAERSHSSAARSASSAAGLAFAGLRSAK
jgi:predicted ester cyclase